MWYSVAGLRKVVAKDKLQFSRRYNEVVLGFQKIEARASKHVIHNDDDSGHIMPSTQVDLTFLAQRLKVQKIRPFQASALLEIGPEKPVLSKNRKPFLYLVFLGFYP